MKLYVTAIVLRDAGGPLTTPSSAVDRVTEQSQTDWCAHY